MKFLCIHVKGTPEGEMLLAANGAPYLNVEFSETQLSNIATYHGIQISELEVRPIVMEPA